MTQSPAYRAQPPAETNGLGIASFVVSLLGLLGTGGLLCPVGLILGLVALGRRPRGFAIAGVVLGGLGTCAGMAVFLLFGAAILAALGVAVAAIALSDPQKMEVTGDMAVIATAVKAQAESQGDLPLDLAGLGLPAAVLVDPWGRPYRYTVSLAERDFDIASDGPDGVPESPDDVRFKRLDELWSARDAVEITTSEQDGSVRIRVGGRELNVDRETGVRHAVESGGGPDAGVHSEAPASSGQEEAPPTPPGDPGPQD